MTTVHMDVAATVFALGVTLFLYLGWTLARSTLLTWLVATKDYEGALSRALHRVEVLEARIDSSTAAATEALEQLKTRVVRLENKSR